MSNLLLLIALVLAGCGKKNPVVEVSAIDSEIEVTASDYEPGSDWNAWRGPRGDGIAPDQPLATEWDESTNVRWRADVPGRGHSSVAVIHNRKLCICSETAVEPAAASE